MGATRDVLSVFAGTLVGSCFNMGMVHLNMYIWPMPPGVSLTDKDPEPFMNYIKSLPPAAFINVLIAHVGQAFTGAILASRLCSSNSSVCPMIVGGLTFAGGVSNWFTLSSFMTVPRFMLIEFPLYFVAAHYGGKIGSNLKLKSS